MLAIPQLDFFGEDLDLSQQRVDLLVFGLQFLLYFDQNPVLLLLDQDQPPLLFFQLLLQPSLQHLNLSLPLPHHLNQFIILVQEAAVVFYDGVNLVVEIVGQSLFGSRGPVLSPINGDSLWSVRGVWSLVVRGGLKTLVDGAGERGVFEHLLGGGELPLFGEGSAVEHLLINKINGAAGFNHKNYYPFREDTGLLRGSSSAASRVIPGFTWVDGSLLEEKPHLYMSASSLVSLMEVYSCLFLHITAPFYNHLRIVSTQVLHPSSIILLPRMSTAHKPTWKPAIGMS